MTDTHAYCYKLVTEYLTWADARDKCGTYGGDLVSINTHEEQIFVQQELLFCGYVLPLSTLRVFYGKIYRKTTW